ncbi:MAG: flagellar motor switch protein FliM [Thermaerobacter sp.]|nr:flagellar motor switch protein FliM [Thermaerobacter sp.]
MAKARVDGPAQLKAPTHAYDFRRSRRLSADQMRSLERIHEHYASLLGTYLTAYLRTRVTCELRDVTQTMFEDIVRAQPARSIVATISAEPLAGPAMMQLNADIAHGLIDRLLGGSGDVHVLERAFTDIDVHVLERGVPIFVETLGEAWTSVERLRTGIRLLEASPQFLRLVGPQDAVVQVTLEVSFAHMTGEIGVVLPYDALKPILPKLTSVALLTEQVDQQPGDADGARMLQRSAMGIEMELRAVLGSADITVSQFLDLDAGDVVLLGTRADQPVTVYVEGRPKFRAWPRARQRRICLEIDARIAEGGVGRAE